MRRIIERRRLPRRRLLRAAGAGTAGVAALALAACGGDDEDGGTTAGDRTAASGGTAAANAPRKGGRFLGMLGTDVPHLDMHTGRWPIGNIGAMFHAQLLQYKPDGTDHNRFEVVPYVATALPEQPDDTTYIFKLRPNVKFHNVAPVNGRQVTATDVAWSLERVAALGVKPPEDAYFTVRAKYNVIDRIETPDPLTVRVTTKAPNAPFLLNMADFHPSIAPKEMAAKDLQENRIGAGPFLFTEWERDVASTFKRNPDFFLPDRPLLDEIRMTVVKDEAARWAAFKTGQAHSTGVPPNLIPEGEKDKSAQLLSLGTIDPLVMPLNPLPAAKPLDDVRVRRAISLSVNQQEMIDKAFQGRAKASGVLPWTLGEWAVPPESLPYYKHDPAEARRMLAAAGAEGAKLTFITTKNYAAEDDTAALAIAQLKAAGFDVQPQQFEYSVWLDKIGKNEFSAFTIWQGPQLDPDGVFGAFVTSANNRNYGSAALDEKIARQRGLINRQERLKLVQEIQREIAEGAWRIGLPNWYQFQINAGALREYPPMPMWYGSNRWMWNTWSER